MKVQKGQLDNGKTIWLVLDDNYLPVEPISKYLRYTFSEWFKLAKDQGIVKASQGTPKGILVLEPTGDWTPLETMIEKGWTLEYLQKRNES